MDFREMLYITTVADCRSITVAARKLYISQPSLSHIVSKVEQDVGVKLFDRGTSPLTITYAGEKYVETARKILLMSDNLRKELIDAGLGEKGRIVFGMPTERAGYMLPAVIPEFKKQYPGIELHVIEAKSDELSEKMKEGDEPELVRQMMELIWASKGNLSLNECADRLNYHPNYLSKVLKREKGVTFTDIANEEKLKQAKYMLLTTEYSVGEISEKLQYNNVQNFIRFFKNHVGETPAAFRKEHRK